MIRLFRKYLIGGCSGSREGSWALVLLWCAGFSYVAIKEAASIDMSLSADLLTITGPFVIAAWSAAHGLQKFADSGGLTRDQKRNMERAG